MRGKLLGLCRRFAGDEVGAVMTEYIIMLAYLVVGILWLNKVTDTILFGQSPYIYTHNPTATDENLIPPDNLFGDVGPSDGYTDAEMNLLRQVGGNAPVTEAARPDRAYLSQVYIHLSRP